MIGALPFGIIFGALAITSGISIPATMALSIFVFAGSSQFIAVGLVAQGVSVPIIILTTFVVNLRHALYSATLAPFVRRLSQRWLLLLGYMLTDRSFVITNAHYNEPGDIRHKHWYFLGANLTIFIPWQIFTWIGIFAGSLIAEAEVRRLGLDFAMSVTFIGMLVPMVRNRPALAAAVVAGGVALVTYSLPNKIGLTLALLAGVAAGVFFEARTQPTIPEPEPEEAVHE